MAALLGGCGSGDSEEPEERTKPKASKPERAVKTKPKHEPDREREAELPRVLSEAKIPSEAKSTTVTGVTDGDTVKLAGLGPSRLIGVDTPEVYFGVECYGAEASAFTKDNVPSGATVHYVRGVERTDRYDRDLVYLWLESGRFFNAMLAERGYAVTLTIPPNVEYAELFRRLATEARKAERGLWSSSTCGGDPDKPEGGAGGSGGSGGGGGFGGQGGGGGCEPGYEPCVPTYPPDLDCADVFGPITVNGKDPHGLDGDGDGVGCE